VKFIRKAKGHLIAFGYLGERGKRARYIEPLRADRKKVPGMGWRVKSVGGFGRPCQAPRELLLDSPKNFSQLFSWTVSLLLISLRRLQELSLDRQGFALLAM